MDTSVSPSSANQPSTPDKLDSPNVDHEASNEDYCFRTPHKPSKALLQTASFYNGLDSSAGAKLLMSPAITGRTRSYTAQDSPSQVCGTAAGRLTVHPVCIQTAEQSDNTEEISRLKHSVRVLEGTLKVEKKLAQEYYTELCSKILECEVLKNSHSQLERKLDCLKEMGDIQDELDHATVSLTMAEKSIMNYKNKIEVLEGYKEKTTELEAMMNTYEAKVALCEDYRLVSEFWLNFTVTI